MPVQVIRGVYDGKTIRPLPTETLPEVEGEVPVEIVLLDPAPDERQARQRRLDAAERIIDASKTRSLQGLTVRDLIDDGRYR